MTVLPAVAAAAGPRHPVIAGNGSGERILVWTEGTGGRFDEAGRPTGDRGEAPGVPSPAGGFTVTY